MTVPLTVIGGYLGAGKTTLVNRVIRECDTSRFAILVNDFGKLEIDAELIELEGGRAFRLESGCICCNVGNGLMTTLMAVLRAEPRPEHILVEASGVADPARIADIARLSPSLHAGRTVVLADTGQIEAQLADALVGDTVRRQIDAADILVLNKQSLAVAGTIDRLASRFAGIEMLSADHADFPVELIFGPGRFHEPPPDDPRHDHVFWSAGLHFSGPVSRAALLAALGRPEPHLVRAKGFVRFADDPGVLVVVQLAGGRTEIAELRGGGLPASTECRLQLIGTGPRPADAELESTFCIAPDPVSAGGPGLHHG